MPVEAQSGVTAIAGGDGHALALKDGQVIAWGLRGDEQATVPVEAQSGVTAIAAGSVSMAIKDVRVIAWTSDGSAQAPVPFAALSGLPAGGPPRIPYWHAGILHVRGIEIKTPFPVGEIQVAGDTVIIASQLDGNDDQVWALVTARDRRIRTESGPGWPIRVLSRLA